MRVFWAIIVALVIATVVLLAMRQKRNDAPAPELAIASEREAPARDHSFEPEAPAREEPPKPEAPVSNPAPEAPVSEQPNPVPPPSIPSPAVEAPPAPVSDAPATPDTPSPANVVEEPPAQTPAGASQSEGANPPPLFREQFEIVPARTKPGDNGVTIYDERFPVKGVGTPEDPIDIPWDHLVSASETFQPRMGKKRIPERITMLDGKHVRVTGYVAFPIMAAAQNEMLSMRNMWDGCCIGVPPTPYDAVEVKLKNAATGKDRFTAFGTVEGVMKVDPYIKGNWLLGLYLLEDATLTQLKDGADPGKHGGL